MCVYTLAISHVFVWNLFVCLCVIAIAMRTTNVNTVKIVTIRDWTLCHIGLGLALLRKECVSMNKRQRVRRAKAKLVSKVNAVVTANQAAKPLEPTQVVRAKSGALAIVAGDGLTGSGRTAMLAHTHMGFRDATAFRKSR